ncbi:MAG: pentapeptide repeat-containing protein [Pseudonocardiales bacterium]|nr:pentapeptide repeat-containing protein [Pseudonocardiales bacterium]MBW0010675.1 pentapeptide repeat-containing protein [Pseudonocardiales bacterium]
MTAPSNRPDPPTPRPLSNWSIAAGAVVLLAIATVVSFVLLRRYGGRGAQIQLDAIRTAGTLVIGTGGAVALLLTARRQRYTELTLVHTTSDATERRITELYTKAADQLGSDKAPVRLAGLYALERLAQNTPEQRQTIVDVLCAYLRMPYTLPEDQPPNEDAPDEAHTRYANRREEQQVRLAAQDILSRNLRVVGQRRRRGWHRTPPNARVDLTGALLLKFSLADCQLGYANFAHAQFKGEADFMGALFTGKANFEGAQFTGVAHFWGAEFTGEASFERAKFKGVADFRRAWFTDLTQFKRAKFASLAHFNDAEFTTLAQFERVKFASAAFFRDARFTGVANFESARFTGGVAHFWGVRFNHLTYFTDVHFTDQALFQDAQFTDEASFERAQFNGNVDFRELDLREVHFPARGTGVFRFQGARATSTASPSTRWPPGWTTRPAIPGKGEDPNFLYLTQA